MSPAVMYAAIIAVVAEIAAVILLLRRSKPKTPFKQYAGKLKLKKDRANLQQKQYC